MLHPFKLSRGNFQTNELTMPHENRLFKRIPCKGIKVLKLFTSRITRKRYHVKFFSRREVLNKLTKYKNFDMITLRSFIITADYI